MSWQSPSGGLFTSDMQVYFWQAVFWLLTQAAPLIMIMFAAFMIGVVAAVVIRVVRASETDDPEDLQEDWEDD